MIRSCPHLEGEYQSIFYSTLNEPIVPYYCDQKGELNGQKEKTLPRRKLIRSGTLLGRGGADLLFTQRLNNL